MDCIYDCGRLRFNRIFLGSNGGTAQIYDDLSICDCTDFSYLNYALVKRRSSKHHHEMVCTGRHCIFDRLYRIILITIFGMIVNITHLIQPIAKLNLFRIVIFIRQIKPSSVIKAHKKAVPFVLLFL